MAKGFGQPVMTPQQEQEAKLLRTSVLSHFQHLRDPRVGRRQEHNLVAILITDTTEAWGSEHWMIDQPFPCQQPYRQYHFPLLAQNC